MLFICTKIILSCLAIYYCNYLLRDMLQKGKHFVVQAQIMWIAKHLEDNAYSLAMDESVSVNTRSISAANGHIVNISSVLSGNYSMLKQYSTIQCYLNNSNGLDNMDRAAECDLKKMLCGMYDVYCRFLFMSLLSCLGFHAWHRTDILELSFQFWLNYLIKIKTGHFIDCDI